MSIKRVIIYIVFFVLLYMKIKVLAFFTFEFIVININVVKIDYKNIHNINQNNHLDLMTVYFSPNYNAVVLRSKDDNIY